MVRMAGARRVFFIEEPIDDAERPSLTVTVRDGVHVVVPRITRAISDTVRTAACQSLIRGLIRTYGIEQPVLWFYTPMAQPLVEDVTPAAVVYDCMDELSGFANAPSGIRAAERALLKKADLMFTGGHALFEAKRGLHWNIHPFPSSVDVAHFAGARNVKDEPADQQNIPHPRVGFSGVIDERMDVELVAAIARRHPDWQIVMLGPVVKIETAALPALPNIHYLGMRPYAELPQYFAGWDVALMPFAHNAATRFISPTKTPEYLAAGLPVVSTSVADVVRPYGEEGLVFIADGPDDFEAAIARALGPEGEAAVRKAAPRLARMSWDRTFEGMDGLLAQAIESRARRSRVPMQPRSASTGRRVGLES